MRYQIYSVLDTVMQEHFLPFYARNDAHAQRLVYEQVIRDPEWRIHQAELRMFHIGEFDPETGTIESCQPANIAIPTKLEIPPEEAVLDYATAAAGRREEEAAKQEKPNGAEQ